MGRIAVGEALGAGFSLIRREPVAFLAWCVIYFLAAVIPQALVWPQMAEAYREAAGGGGNQAVLALESRLRVFQPLSLLLLLANIAVLPAAVFRAVLFPGERNAFYLRLGMREFWTLIVTIVVGIVLFLAILAVLIPIFVLTFGAVAVAGARSPGVVLVVTLLAYVAGMGVFLWVVLRFSLAPVMSFAENTFRLGESWRLTKGNAWRMFLVGLGLVGLVLLLEILLFGGAFAFLVAARPNGLQAFTDPGALAALMAQVTLPMVLAGGAAFAVFGVWSYVMGAAAWASIYRQLSPTYADTFA